MVVQIKPEIYQVFLWIEYYLQFQFRQIRL